MENILMSLFIELFEVNHIMLDLMDFLDDNCGDEILFRFCKDKIADEFTREEIIEYNKQCSYSCLGDLSEKELIDFLNELYI